MAKSTRSSATAQTIVSQGQFNGCRYEITRNGPSAFLSVRLTDNAKLIFYTNLNNIVARSGDINIQSHPQFSLKNIFMSLEMIQSTVTGPGEILLGSPIW